MKTFVSFVYGVKVFICPLVSGFPFEKQSSLANTSMETTMPMPRMKKEPCMSETETMAVALIPPRAELVHSFSGGQ